MYSQHAFIVYSISIQAVGARAIVTPAKNWGHDLKAMAKAIVEDTRVVFIANPNNPTGTSFRLSEFVEFMRKVPENVLVVLDEAYYEYAADEYHPDGVALLSEYPNLIVTRTFSKAYGLAALRVGYAVAAANVAALINRVRAPFNTNSFALSAAEAVLSDQDYLDRSRQLNNDGMVQLTAGMEKLGLDYIPSSGNFLINKKNGLGCP